MTQSDAASQSRSESESEEGEDEEPNNNPDINSTLAQISFGALAKAQESLGPRRKLKRSRSAMDEEDEDDEDHSGDRHKRAAKPTTATTSNPLDDIRARIRAAKEEKANAASKPSGKDRERTSKDITHRTSKHAPAVQSSKHAVSRRRTVVDTVNNLPVKSRDPRFDGAVPSYNPAGNSKYQSKSVPKPHPSAEGVGNKNYAFLEEYRASELAALRAQMAKTKNPDEKEELKKTITSMRDRQRAYSQRQKEREVVAEHKRKEREMIRDGKKSKAWFMKKGDVKKEVLKKRYEEMGSRERQKGLERRRKKVASKERKNMPDARRGAVE